MTCPRCGTMAGDGQGRCHRCGGSLTRPSSQPAMDIPVPRAPTNRGEAAQRAAGVVTRVLVRPRPTPPPAPAPGAPPAGWATGQPGPPQAGPQGPAAPPVGAAPAVAPGAHAAASAPGAPDGRATDWAAAGGAQAVPPSALPPRLAPVDPSTPPPAGVVLPPPPPPIAGLAASRTDPPTLADITLSDVRAAARPAAAEPHGHGQPSAAADQPGPHHQPGEAPAEGRRRGDPSVPALEAPWPPPPGPWSGRRTGRS